VIRRPNPILQEEPSKELNFRGRPSLPHQLVHVGGDGSKEMNLISRFGGVFAFFRKPPNNVILHVLPKLNVVNKNPKLDKLFKLLHVVDFFQIDLLHPIVVRQGLMDLRILPF
jgi:hypothetical protein